MKFKIEEKPKYTITVIGAGGTGGYLVQILSRIAYESEKEIEIYIIDGDKIEEKNVGRQNFYHTEIGEYKAQILAERYSLAFGIKIIPINNFLEENSLQEANILYKSDFIISCVDSANARKIIHNILSRIKKEMKTRIEQNHALFSPPGLQVWIDTGNSKNFGQILIGNSFEENTIKKQKGEEIFLLPYPSIIEPDIINEKKDKDEKNISCAERTALKEQSTTINQLMASTAGSIINNLIEKGEILSNKIMINEEIPMIVSKLVK